MLRSLTKLDLPRLDVPTVPSFDGLVAALLFTACDTLGVEGLVLKRRSSLYWPGTRTLDWRNVKCAAPGGNTSSGGCQHGPRRVL
jgi:ATP-dependent DNA ligase